MFAAQLYPPGPPRPATPHQSRLASRLDRLSFSRSSPFISRAQAELSRENAEGDLRTDWRELPVMHVVESQQFSPYSLDYIFKRADKMEHVRAGSPEAKELDGRIMSTLFYEPSTRTRLSFESAMTRLGGQVLSTENAGSFSSAAKGETLEGEHCCIRPCCCDSTELLLIICCCAQMIWLEGSWHATCRYHEDNPVLC